MSVRTYKLQSGSNWIDMATPETTLKSSSVFQAYDDGVLYVNNAGQSQFHCMAAPFQPPDMPTAWIVKIVPPNVLTPILYFQLS